VLSSKKISGPKLRLLLPHDWEKERNADTESVPKCSQGFLSVLPHGVNRAELSSSLMEKSL